MGRTIGAAHSSTSCAFERFRQRRTIVPALAYELRADTADGTVMPRMKDHVPIDALHGLRLARECSKHDHASRDIVDIPGKPQESCEHCLDARFLVCHYSLRSLTNLIGLYHLLRMSAMLTEPNDGY